MKNQEEAICWIVRWNKSYKAAKGGEREVIATQANPWANNAL